jgi:hypothetical protein
MYDPAAVKARDFSSFDFRVIETGKASTEDVGKVLALFEMSYRQANRNYLEKSLGTLRYLALAEHEGTLAGFALGETRVMDLPRLPAQVVSLGGLGCVAIPFRRRGLGIRLELLVLTAAELPWHTRRLICGRMAHPLAMRLFVHSPTVVPKPGVRPTSWQQEIGQAIAEAYGVHAFDLETFVCVGTGEPIGYPIIEFEVPPEEWEVFRQVNRDRGDSLLAMIWTPDAPPGW